MVAGDLVFAGVDLFGLWLCWLGGRFWRWVERYGSNVILGLFFVF